MRFNGLDGNAEVGSDLFVQAAADNTFKNVQFTRCQLAEKCVVELALFSFKFALTGFLKHSFD